MNAFPTSTPAARAHSHRAGSFVAVLGASWPALALLLLAAVYRVWLAWQTAHSGSFGTLFSWLPGFCPLAALTLCGGWFLPRRWALAAPLVMLLITDLAITTIYGWQPLGGGAVSAMAVQMLSRYAVLGVVGVWALKMRGGRAGAAIGAFSVLAATVAGSIIFYVATNTFSWLTLPGYALTATGWWQALTTGLPGYLPSWMFLRNAVVSDFLYSSLMLVAVRAAQRSPAQLQRIAPLARPKASAGAH